MQLYKVVGPSLESIHGGTFDWTPYVDTGEWTPYITAPVVCRRGYHLTTDPMQWPKVGMRVFEAEGREFGGQEDDKRVYGSVRLFREVPEIVPQWWRDAEAFVASIADVPWLQHTQPPDPSWRMFATRTAARDAARVAGKGAARVAARGAARGAAKGAARVAAWDAAQGAAKGAAWVAARVAVRDAAWVAAWDASLMAQMLVCTGKVEQHHFDYAVSRWEVWKRGYGMVCDVDGVLYVYESV